MILTDFVMLGTTVPEPSHRSGRIYVCSAGVSAEWGKLVRIYPLARRNVPHRWGIYRVPLERNPDDNRDESFRLVGDRSPGAHERINDVFDPVGELPDTQRASLLKPYVVGGIREANERSRAARTPRDRISLAIIHPRLVEVYFTLNDNDSDDHPQMSLFDRPGEPPSGARRFPLMPRLRFMDDDGENNVMLRDWGTFELQRKKGADYFRMNLAAALHLRPDSSLLVGNLANQRTAWVAISVLNGVREAPSLFDALPSERQPVPPKLRMTTLRRDGFACVRCGSRANLTVDHKFPHIRGGALSLENLQTLCGTCNCSKGDSTTEAA